MNLRKEINRILTTVGIEEKSLAGVELHGLCEVYTALATLEAYQYQNPAILHPDIVHRILKDPENACGQVDCYLLEAKIEKKPVDRILQERWDVRCVKNPSFSIELPKELDSFTSNLISGDKQYTESISRGILVIRDLKKRIPEELKENFLSVLMKIMRGVVLSKKTEIHKLIVTDILMRLTSDLIKFIQKPTGKVLFSQKNSYQLLTHLLINLAQFPSFIENCTALLTNTDFLQKILAIPDHARDASCYLFRNIKVLDLSEASYHQVVSLPLAVKQKLISITGNMITDPSFCQASYFKKVQHCLNDPSIMKISLPTGLAGIMTSYLLEGNTSQMKQIVFDAFVSEKSEEYQQEQIKQAKALEEKAHIFDFSKPFSVAAFGSFASSSSSSSPSTFSSFATGRRTVAAKRRAR